MSYACHGAIEFEEVFQSIWESNCTITMQRCFKPNFAGAGRELWLGLELGIGGLSFLGFKPDFAGA